METFVSAVKSLLLSWYQITVDNFDYFIAVVSLTGLLLVWLVSLCFRSRWGNQKRYFEKQQQALYQEYDITWHGLESAAHQVQQLKEELLIKDGHIDQITKDSQANQLMANRAVDLDAQLARRNNELSQLVSMLEAENGIGEQLPAINGLDSDALWQRHVEAAKQLTERMRHNQQLATEFQQTQQGLSAQIAEQQADILDLQQAITAKDGQIGQLTDEIETQKVLATDKLNHIQEDLSAQIAEQQATIQNLQQVLTARDSQISELTEEIESQKTVVHNEFNQAQQDLSAQIAEQQIAIKDLQSALTAKENQISQLTAGLESQKSIAQQELAKASALLAAKETAVIAEKTQPADKSSKASFDSETKVTKAIDVVGNAETEPSGIDVNVAKSAVAESVQKISVAEAVAKQRATASTIAEKTGATVKNNTKPEKKSWLTTLKAKLKTSESPKGKPVAATESVGVGAVAATVVESDKEILPEVASVVELKASDSAMRSDSTAAAGVSVETTTSELSSPTAELTAPEIASVDAIATVEAVVVPDENPSASSEVSDKTVAMTELPSKAVAKKKSWFSPISNQFSALIGKDKQTAEVPTQPAIEQSVENITFASTEQVLMQETSGAEIAVDVSSNVDSGTNEVGGETVVELGSDPVADGFSEAEISVEAALAETAGAEGYPITGKKSWISTITKQLKFSPSGNKSKSKPVNLEPETLTDSLPNVGAVDETVIPLVAQTTELPDESSSQEISSGENLAEAVVEAGTASESTDVLDVVGSSEQENGDVSALASTEGSENSIVESVIDVLGLAEEPSTDSTHMNYVRTLDDIAIEPKSARVESESPVGVSDVAELDGENVIQSVEMGQVVAEIDEAENTEGTTDSSEAVDSGVVAETEVIEEDSVVDSIIDVLGLAEEPSTDSTHMNYVRTLDDIAIEPKSARVESESPVGVSDVAELDGENVIQSVEMGQVVTETGETENAEGTTDSSEAVDSGVVAESEVIEEGSVVDSIIDVLGLADESSTDSTHMSYVRTLDDIAIGSKSPQVESESPVGVSDVAELDGENVIQSVEMGQAVAETDETENVEGTTDSSKAVDSGVVAETEVIEEGSVVDSIIDVLGLADESSTDSTHMNYVRTLDDIAIEPKSARVESESPVGVSDVVDVADESVGQSVEIVAETGEAQNTELAIDSAATDSFEVAEEEAPVDSIHMNYVRTLDDIAIAPKPAKIETEALANISDIADLRHEVGEEIPADNSEQVNDAEVAEFLQASESTAIDGISIADVLGLSEDIPEEPVYMDYVRTLDDIAIAAVSQSTVNVQLSADTATIADDADDRYTGNKANLDGEITPELITAETKIGEQAKLEPIYMDYVRSFEDIAVSPINKPAQAGAEEQGLNEDNLENKEGLVVQEPRIAVEGSWLSVIKELVGIDTASQSEPVYMDYVRSMDDISLLDKTSENEVQAEEMPEIVKLESASLLSSVKKLLGRR